MTLVRGHGRSRLIGALVTAGVLVGALVEASPAGAVSTSVTVSAGSLAATFPATLTMSTVTLNGNDQTSTGTYAVDIKDATGSGTGWKLQLTSTQFKDTGTHTLPIAATTIAAAPTGANLACDALTTCTLATTNVTYPYTVPAQTVAPTATSFFNAAANTGMGNQTATFSFATAIAANTFVPAGGAYTSTWTFSQVSGP